jgi:hypothetical protein
MNETYKKYEFKVSFNKRKEKNKKYINLFNETISFTVHDLTKKEILILKKYKKFVLYIYESLVEAIEKEKTTDDFNKKFYYKEFVKEGFFKTIEEALKNSETVFNMFFNFQLNFEILRKYIHTGFSIITSRECEDEFFIINLSPEARNFLLLLRLLPKEFYIFI